jgi:DUF4097 and DUF4098 domain-containing protein YvlB
MLKRLALAAALSASFVMLYARDEAREEFHQTYPLAANGRVGVHNVNGAIHVSAWDRNEVKVDAVKHGEDEKALKEARIVVDARADAVEIRTKYPEDCHGCRPASVEYTITVPRGAALDPINTVNGSVTVEGVAGHVKVASVNGRVEVRKAVGDLDLSTVNGRVEGGFDQLAARHISMKSVNGAIALALPKDAGAHLTISTVHGGVTSDFDLPRERERYGPGRHVDTQIGGGGAEISLSTVNGGINLTRQ